MSGGAPKSAGTRDTKVQRQTEGLPGLATVENPTANPPSYATLDTGLVHTGSREIARGNIDTTQTSGLTPDQDIKRGNPNAWV